MLKLKKLHDLLVLKITQEDKERGKFPLVKIVGRRGIKWEPEFPVDKGYIDIYVPAQKNIEHSYAIEVETGYDINCSGILQKFERFKKGIPTKHKHEISVRGEGLIMASSPIKPKLCVVIPKDFAEFIPLFQPGEISVFLWEGKLEWKCKKCGKITSKEGPWKPLKCDSCKKPERSLQLTGLRDLEIKEAYRVQ